MKVLVTGGAGYIGSHTVRVLQQEGHEVGVLDNLSEGHRESLPQGIEFYERDLRVGAGLKEVFVKGCFDAVVHFAAFALVGESVENPEKYYENNVIGTKNLLDAMIACGVKKIVFSSSAATYGAPEELLIPENVGKNPINPYGRTKLIVEGMLADYDKAYGLKSISLRYFNAAGAGLGIGEDHKNETHLIPLILQAALGQRDSIKVFGTDYETKDGTCIRDYIHVLDLASAHVLALRKLGESGKSDVYNVGIGSGYSVREVIDVAKKISGREFSVVDAERRPGDPRILVADSSRIKRELGWEPKFHLNEIISSAWEWHRKNPKGFGDAD